LVGWTRPAGSVEEKQGLRISEKPEVIYDDGFRRIYAPSVETNGWCTIEFPRVRWVEEAEARAAAAERDRQAPELTPRGAAPVVAVPRARPLARVEVRPSQVRAGDGGVICAADVLCQVSCTARPDLLWSHGLVADDLAALECPDCFSPQ
jgi:hypothetical protein